MNKKIFFMLILIYFSITITISQSLDKKVSTNFNDGIKLYKDSNYSGALKIFQKLYSEQYDNFNINYNIGCCEFKLEQYGRARFYFERALKFKPFDKDLFHNLKATYKKISNNPSNYEFIIMNKRIIYFFPLSVLLTVIIILFMLLFVFGLLLLKNINFKLFLILITISAFFLVVFTSLFFIQYSDYTQKVCVVIKEDANIYLSPDDENAILKLLPQGAKGCIVSETPSYYRVKFENNVNGWINKQDTISK